MITASIIVPTYNRGDLIINTLAALSRQTVSREDMEVIIVDDGSTDSTKAEVERYLLANQHKQWQYFRFPENKGKATVCNKGILATRSSLIVFLDDDCVPTPHWLGMHIERHATTEKPISVLGGVSFPQEWVKKSNFIRYANSKYVGNRSIRSVGGNLDDLPPRFFGGLNISVPKQQLIDVGLFDERIGRGQDVELGYRLWKAGVKLVFERRASVIHYEPETRSPHERITKHARVYQESVPLIKAIQPDLGERFGNWYLEPPEYGCEPIRRTLVKVLFRVLVHKSIAYLLLRVLEQTDRYPQFYWPPLYQYLFASACLQSVNRRQE